jgi:hypothetical protein
VCRFIAKLIHFLCFKRSASLSGEALQVLSVTEDEDDCKDEQDKLGKELEAIDAIFSLGPLLNPRTDNQRAEDPNDAVDCEEDQEAKEDIIEGLHLLSTDTYF